MFSLTRMQVRFGLSAVLLIAATNGCSNQKPAPFEPETRVLSDDHEAPFNPQERYPGWAFDQPEYMQPTNALDSEIPVRGDDPNHFFTNNCVVLIEQPNGYTPEEIPRVAVYRSDDNGFSWKRDGMFGREQGYYALETHSDGDYGIRFVGPGQQLAERTPADPQRVYHVDTEPPVVEIEINPEKTWYMPGDQIKIAWSARDRHLIANPVRLGMLMDFTGDVRNLVELQRDLADEGSMVYRIMPDTAGHEIVFRVEALDRAENLGLAYSHHLQVVDRDAEQIVQKRKRRPHDDRLPRPQATPRTAPVSPQKSQTMEVMTPISRAESSNDRKPMTIGAAAQPSTPTLISAASTTNKNIERPRAESKIQSIVRPEREPMHEAMVIRAPAKNNNDSTAPKMASMTVMPATSTNAVDDSSSSAVKPTTASVTTPKQETVATSKKPSLEPAAGQEAVDTKEVIASFKTAFDKIATTVATAAREAEAQAPTKSESPQPMEDRSDVVATKPDDASQEDAWEATPTVVTVSAPAPTMARRNLDDANGSAPVAAPTAGSLVAPMPGVVANQGDTGNSHPWRSLGNKSDTDTKSPVWSLPSDKPTLHGRPTIRTVEQPNRTQKTYAGTPTEDETPGF